MPLIEEAVRVGDLNVWAFSWSIVAVHFPKQSGRKLLFSRNSEFGCETVARPGPMGRQSFIIVAVIAANQGTGGLDEAGSRSIEQFPQGSVARTPGRRAEAENGN